MQRCPTPVELSSLRPARSAPSSPYTLKTDYWSSHSLILRLIKAPPGSRVLDVGAAEGYLSRLLTERGLRVTAIERDPAMADVCRYHCDSVVIADLDQPFPLSATDKFDVIICADVLEHLRDPLAVLRGLAHYLRPAGKVIISVPNVAHLWIRLQLLAGRFNYTDRGILDRTHLRFFTLKTFRDFLDNGGFAIESVTATPVPLALVVPERFHGKLFNAIYSLTGRIANLSKRLFGYQFVAVVTPKTEEAR
jgi:methionine biosynthesis protein MetW